MILVLVLRYFLSACFITDSRCGPRLVNVSGPTYLAVTGPYGLSYTCTWQVTSEGNTFLSIKVAKMEIQETGYVIMGNGHDIGVSPIAKETKRQIPGTLYFFSGHQLWLVASTLKRRIHLRIKISAGEAKGQVIDLSFSFAKSTLQSEI